MGNLLACTLTNSSLTTSIKVVLPNNTIHRITEPTTAAELMLDYSGNFITNAKSMQVGKRLLALPADEELEMACVYVMLPMKRLNAVCASSDMARLLVLANKEAKKSSLAKVQPDCRTRKVDEVEDEQIAMEIGEFKQRLSCGRSRRPGLETIEEDNFSSR